MPAFLLHQNISGRRLKLLLHHMTEVGAEREGGVIEGITQWLVHTATAEDIWGLPALLKRTKLQRVADRLQRKLQRVADRLQRVEDRLQERL